MGYKPEEKFRSVRDNLDKVLSGFDKDNKKSENYLPKETLEEKIRKIIPELEKIYKELDKLNSRRIKLLHKKNLSGQEREELGLLNEIMDDVGKLQKFILDVTQYNTDIGKDIVVRSGNPELMIKMKDKFGISNMDIMTSVKPKLYEDKLKYLSLLQFSDKEVQELYDYGGVSFILELLLKHCSLSEKQKQLIYDNLFYGNGGRVLDDALLFQQVNIPKSLQNRMISILERYVRKCAKNPSECFDAGVEDDHDMMGFLQSVDLLGSPNFSEVQKRKIAGALIVGGNALDCQAIIHHYPQYLDRRSRVIANEKIKKSKEKIKIPSLYEIDPNKLKGKKIQFVTHPFYDLGFRSKKEIQAHVVEEIKKAIKAESKNSKLKHYLGVLDIMQEYERYENLQNDPNTVTIFIMPRFYSPGAGAILIQNFQGPNTYYMESDKYTDGTLKQLDLKRIGKMIPEESDIAVSGGYINACMEASIRDLLSVIGGRRITMDYSDSTLSPDDFPTRGLNSLPALPNTDSINFEDAKRIIKANTNFNESYEKKVRKDYDVHGNNLDHPHSKIVHQP